MSLRQLDHDGVCCICLESLLEGGRQTLTCGHVMHELCVLELRRLGASGKCPLCREASADLTTFQALVEQAATYFLRKSWAECYHAASEVLDCDSTNIDMLCLMARLVFYGWGCPRDVERALGLFEHHHLTGHPKILVGLAGFYVHLHRLPDAECLLDQALQSDNAEWWAEACRAEALLNLGKVRLKQGRLRECEELLKKAWSLVPQDPEFSRFLGSLYWQEERFSEAETHFKLALELGDKDTLPLLGGLCLHQGRTKEGERMLEQCCQLGDNCFGTTAFEFLGKLRLWQGRTSEAERLLKIAANRIEQDMTQCGVEVCKLKGDSLPARELGQLYMAQGRTSEAERFLRMAAELGDSEAKGMLMQMKSGPLRCSEINVGTKVFIHGLSSHAHQHLNGQVGFVVCQIMKTGRCGVKLVAGEVEPKSMKPGNLIPITSDEHLEELQAQISIEASISEVGNDVNAQVSSALLRNSSSVCSSPVLLITFSRKPAALRKAFLEETELKSYRQALLDRNYPVELTSGAKILVQPSQYEPLMQFVHMSRYKFGSWHWFLDPSLESIIASIVVKVNAELPQKEKFYQKAARTVPLSFAAMVHEIECDVNILRTFIDIPLPSSLRSVAGSQKKTASTTDAAGGRKGPNPRER